MARRYTIADVVTPGSSVEAFRTAISTRQTGNGSPNKCFSSDTRMRNMFPKSPLYSSEGNEIDKQIIDRFITQSIDIISQSNYDFSITKPAYMNFNHPQAPDLKMSSMNNPVSGADYDKPYYGHPNLQVNSIDPLDERTVETGSEGGLLRKRTLIDGGFGTKNELKNYSTLQVKNSIGQYFSKIYSGVTSNAETQALGKINSTGNSTMKEALEGSNSEIDGNLSNGVNGFIVQS